MREPPRLLPIDETHLAYAGRRWTGFIGSDYFRLSWHPAVRSGAERGAATFGTGACASRMTTGNLPIYRELESRLERFFGAPSATLTSAGYTAPMVAAQALAADHTMVLVDSKAHGCLRDAAALTGLSVASFEHARPDELARRLSEAGAKSRTLVLCNGLDPVDGMVSPIAEYAEVLGDRGTLLVDDAHGAGVLGGNGRGSAEWAGMRNERVVVTLTLSKAFGTYGGVILGEKRLRSSILARSRLFTGNTPPPPPIVTAAIAAVGVLEHEGAELRARLSENVLAVPARLRRLGAGGLAGPGPMFAVSPKSDRASERLSRALTKAGIYPPRIRYPNGPAETFFRFALSSAHSKVQIGELASILEKWAGKEGIGEA